jgi:hypothetical protein
MWAVIRFQVKCLLSDAEVHWVSLTDKHNSSITGALTGIFSSEDVYLTP